MKTISFFMGLVLLASCNTADDKTIESENTYPKMNLKDTHPETKAVQTKLLLQAEEGKVISLQIDAGEQLKEHVSKVPALLVCVSGIAVYEEASGKTVMKEGDYVFIEKDVKHQVDAIDKSNFLLIK